MHATHEAPPNRKTDNRTVPLLHLRIPKSFARTSWFTSLRRLTAVRRNPAAASYEPATKKKKKQYAPSGFNVQRNINPGYRDRIKHVLLRRVYSNNLSMCDREWRDGCEV
jgi:hypothetical protein